MEDGAKGLVKEVKALPKRVRDADCFQGLDLAVKNFLISVPLVADLRSPAMRPRHWQQLMEATKVGGWCCTVSRFALTTMTASSAASSAASSTTSCAAVQKPRQMLVPCIQCL
jgi:hypothetical protein